MRQFFQRFLAWFRQLFQQKPAPIQPAKDEHFSVPIIPDESKPEKSPEIKRGLGIGHGMHRIKKILGRRVQPMTRAEKRLIERRTGEKIK